MIEAFFDILLILIGIVVGLIVAAFVDDYIVDTEPKDDSDAATGTDTAWTSVTDLREWDIDLIEKARDGRPIKLADREFPKEIGRRELPFDHLRATKAEEDEAP